MSPLDQQVARDPPREIASWSIQDYRRFACGQTADFERRYWWLTDPLWSVPGNERRDEHLARNVWQRLHDEILLRDDEVVQEAWKHETVMALGVPNSWGDGDRCSSRFESGIRQCSDAFVESARRRAGGGENFGVSAFSSPRPYVNGGYSFTPDAKRFYSPAQSTAEDWAVEWNVGGERMITKETWHNVDEQTAVLRRGANNDSLVTLVAGRLPVIVSSTQSVTANLAMGRPADLHVETAPARIDPTGVVRAEAQTEETDWLASLELSGDGWRGRSRHGVTAPTLMNGFGLSDPVLVEERFERGGVEVLDAMLPGSSVGGRTVGVYFEVYGVTAGELLGFTLSAEEVRVDRSVLSRIGSLLRLSSSGGLPQRVTWSQAAEKVEGSRMSHYLTVDLGDIAEGEYRLVLRVQRANGQIAASTRLLRATPQP